MTALRVVLAGGPVDGLRTAVPPGARVVTWQGHVYRRTRDRRRGRLVFRHAP